MDLAEKASKHLTTRVPASATVTIIEARSIASEVGIAVGLVSVPVGGQRSRPADEHHTTVRVALVTEDEALTHLVVRDDR